MAVFRIDNSLLSNMSSAIRDLNNKKMEAGWFSSAKYTDGQNVAGIASIQEFGAPSVNIPARPFLRPCVADNEKKWARTSDALLKKVVTGEKTIESTLETLALVVQADIKKSMVNVKAPALADSTVDARLRARSKGRQGAGNIDKPLIDTGYMLATISAEVSDV